MFRSLILAAALLAFTPLAANAGEITLLPSIKLQIGDRDDYGNIIAAGISVKRMNAVIGKAGAIATIIVGEAGVTNIITKPPAE